MDSRACLVCTVPISENHLGKQACRACAAFFKRTQIAGRKFICRQGDSNCSIIKHEKFMCRSCRYDKCVSIGMSYSLPAEEKAREEEVELPISSSSTPEERTQTDRQLAQREYVKQPYRNPLNHHHTEEGNDSQDELEAGYDTYSSNDFLDHEAFNIDEPSCSQLPILHRMKRAYGILCHVRKHGELGSYSPEYISQWKKGVKFIPASYRNVIPTYIVMYSALLDFACMAFEDFKNFPKTENFAVRNIDCMNKIDELYRSAHHFPHDDTIMLSYTTYISLETLDDLLSGCPPELNKEAAKAEIAKNFTKTMSIYKPDFIRFKPTAEEFLALLGLALWNDHTKDLSDEMGEIVNRNRSAIMAELHKYYSRSGTVDYAVRLGELLFLSVTVEKAVFANEEDFQVYNLMNIFSEYAKC